MGLLDKIGSLIGGKKEAEPAKREPTMEEMGYSYKPVDMPKGNPMTQDDVAASAQKSPQTPAPSVSHSHEMSLLPMDRSPDEFRDMRTDRAAIISIYTSVERNAPQRDSAHATVQTQQQPPPLPNMDYVVTPEMRGLAAQVRSEIQTAKISQDRQRETEQEHQSIL